MREAKIRNPVRVEEISEYNAAAIAEKVQAMFAADGLLLRGCSVSVVFCADRAPDRDNVSTNPEFVIGVVEALAGMGARPVHVWDPSPPGLPLFCSEFTPEQAARLRENALIANTDTPRRVRVKAYAAKDHADIRLPKIFYDSDFAIVLPKAKTSIFTEAATSAAALLQLIREEDRCAFHNYMIHQKLVDLYNLRRPDYAIYDALTCGEGQGPLYPTPRRLGLMVGGANAVNVDSVACSLMGFVPGEIDHLRMLADKGYGTVNLKAIQVVPEDYAKHRKIFRRPEWNIEDVSEKIKVIGGRKKFCAAGCVGFARQALENLLEGDADRIGEPITLIIGEPIEPFEKAPDKARTIVIGDCAEKFQRLGRFLPGCSPNPVEIEIAALETLGVRGSRGIGDLIARKLGASKVPALEAMRARAYSDTGRASIPRFAALRSGLARSLSGIRFRRRKRHRKK